MFRQNCLIGEKEYLPSARVNESLAQYQQFIQYTQKALFSLLKGMLFIVLLSLAVLPLLCLVFFVNDSEFRDQELE